MLTKSRLSAILWVFVPAVALILEIPEQLSANSAATIGLQAQGVWSQFSGPPDGVLSMSMISSSDGWAISNQGNSAETWRWSGTAWINAGTVTHTQSIVRGEVFMLSASDGWTVLGGPLDSGPMGPTEQSIVYRWNGISWTQVMTAAMVSLSAMDMVSSNDGWAVGAYSFGSKFYQWSGSTWQYHSTVLLPIHADRDIDMISPADGWAVGGRILRWNGSSWTEATNPVTTTLRSVEMLSATDGWIVGDRGVILRWNGTAWIQVTSPVTTTLKSVAMISASDGWAVGGGYNFSTSSYEPGVILHWNGITWSRVPNLTSYGLSNVTVISATDGFIVGGDDYNGQDLNPPIMLRFIPFTEFLFLPLIQR